MPDHIERKFLKDAERICLDLNHRKTIRFNISRYDEAVEKGHARYLNLELAREHASGIKQHVLKYLPDYLEEFEKNAIGNGSEVFWASDAKDAQKIIGRIISETGTDMLVKSKSMTTEEIEINHYLKKLGVRAFETDLGEFIVQEAGEKPYHIVTPAMHKSRNDIAALFNEKFGTSAEASPEELTKYVRHRLRKVFKNAKVGLTGANFLLANEGAVALTENEGNGMLTFSLPKVHIVLAGIEKIIPSYHDLDLLWPLLAAHGTGQKVTVYNSVIFGPRKSNETDGPERMVIVLLDNGRSALYNEVDHCKALACIRCGACLNACPVYKNIGGYTYNSVYGGPIGAVIMPHLKGIKNYQHLSFASSLCGKCAEVCPVKIPLPELLLKNRKKAVDKGFRPVLERLIMSGLEPTLKSRQWLDIKGGKFKNLISNLTGIDKSLGGRRLFPVFSSTSFNKQWKSKRSNS